MEGTEAKKCRQANRSDGKDRQDLVGSWGKRKEKCESAKTVSIIRIAFMIVSIQQSPMGRRKPTRIGTLLQQDTGCLVTGRNLLGVVRQKKRGGVALCKNHRRLSQLTRVPRE